LQLTAADQPVVQPDGGKGSYIAGLLSLDFVDPGTGARADGHLTVAEMQQSRIEDVLKARASLDANVQLHLAAAVAGSTHFPRFESDFGFRWKYDTSTPATNGVQSLGFTNVRVSLSDFISSTVAPLLQKIDTALPPFKGIAEALGKPLPVISDLVG